MLSTAPWPPLVAATYRPTSAVHVITEVRRRNAAAMRRVAAGLPACVVAPEHCPLHNSNEAASPARATASTTTTRSGGHDGCFTKSA